MRRFNLLLLLPLLLSSCATGPAFDTSRVNRSLTPGNSVARLPAAEGRQVLWGGVIVSTTNLKGNTHIEVLGYPLDTKEKPQREQESLGRFILQVTGFLEPATYAKDRMVTVVGTLAHSQAAGDWIGLNHRFCETMLDTVWHRRLCGVPRYQGLENKGSSLP